MRTIERSSIKLLEKFTESELINFWDELYRFMLRGHSSQAVKIRFSKSHPNLSLQDKALIFLSSGLF